jgi:hypothetical protein
MGQTYRIGKNEAKKSIDELGNTLQDGDTLLLAAGESSTTVGGKFALWGKNITVRTDGSPRHRIVSTNTNDSAIWIGFKASNCVISDVDVEAAATAGILVQGTQNTIQKVGLFNRGMIELRGSVNAVIDGVTCSDPRYRDYGVYSGAGCSGTVIRNCDLNLTVKGQHCTRHHSWSGLTIEDCHFTNVADYHGSTINLREGNGASLKRVKASGYGIGIGPLNEPNQKPDFRTTNVVIDACDFDHAFPFTLYAGTDGATIRNTIIRSKQEAVKIAGDYVDPTGFTFPAAKNVLFEGVRFYSPTTLITGPTAGVKFKGCFWNDKPVPDTDPVDPTIALKKQITDLTAALTAANAKIAAAKQALAA